MTTFLPAPKKQRVSLTDEPAVRRRFRQTLIDDPATKAKYYKYLRNYSDEKYTYTNDYRGLYKRG